MPFLGKEMSPNIDHKSWEFQGTKTTPPAWKEGLTRAVFTITSLGALFPGGEHSRGYPSIPMNKGVATQVIHNPWGFFSLRTPPTIPGTMESGLFVGGMKSNQIICQVGLPKNKKESRFWKKKRAKKNIHLNLAERNFLNIDLKTSWCIRWVDQHLFDPGRPQLVGLEPFKHLELWVVLEGGSDWNLEILEKEICLYNWHAGMYDFLTENHHSPFFLGNFRCFRKMLNCKSSNRSCQDIPQPASPLLQISTCLNEGLHHIWTHSRTWNFLQPAVSGCGSFRSKLSHNPNLSC